MGTLIPHLQKSKGELADTLTVLRSLGGPLTKTVRELPDGWHVKGFSAGRWFSVGELPIAGFDDLTAALDGLSTDPYRCVIRGRPLPGIDRRRSRRLSDREQHGDAVTFEPASRRWVSVDVDGLKEPPGLCFAAEPAEGAAHARDCLPQAFADASCWWQATASAGIEPGINVRLWFWLDRPLADAQVKVWLRGFPADATIYTPVAAHYTAAPLLAGRDPVARRTGLLAGLADTVAVPDLPAAVPAPAPVEHAPVAAGPLTADEIALLRDAIGRSRRALGIWRGEDVILTPDGRPDRSRLHAAFLHALLDEECIVMQPGFRRLLDAAIPALDAHLKLDPSKSRRPDYRARTVDAAVLYELRS